MPIRHTRESILQNLRDAGCDSETIRLALEALDEQRLSDCLRLLAVHRCTLLEQLHREERKIDCLDYLVYELEKVKTGHE